MEDQRPSGLVCHLPAFAQRSVSVGIPLFAHLPLYLFIEQELLLFNSCLSAVVGVTIWILCVRAVGVVVLPSEDGQICLYIGVGEPPPVFLELLPPPSTSICCVKIRVLLFEDVGQESHLRNGLQVPFFSCGVQSCPPRGQVSSRPRVGLGSCCHRAYYLKHCADPHFPPCDFKMTPSRDSFCVAVLSTSEEVSRQYSRS